MQIKHNSHMFWAPCFTHRQRRLYFSDGLGMGRAMASLVAPWWWKGKISIQDGKATYNFHVADINTHCVVRFH